MGSAKTPETVSSDFSLDKRTKGARTIPQQNLSGLPPVAISAVPNGTLHAPYFMQWSLGIERQFGTTASMQAQYVGTRAVN